MTTKYAALLRGINVGGSRKVPMADLRALLTSLGHDAVRTHLQSGQAVFAAAHGDEDSLAAELAEAIGERFGFPVDVIVRDHAYLRSVVEACPFPAAELEARQLHVTYFSAPVEADRFAAIDAPAFRPEEFRLATAPCTSTHRTVWAAPSSPRPSPDRASTRAWSPPAATGTRSPSSWS